MISFDTVAVRYVSWPVPSTCVCSGSSIPPDNAPSTTPLTVPSLSSRSADVVLIYAVRSSTMSCKLLVVDASTTSLSALNAIPDNLAETAVMLAADNSLAVASESIAISAVMLLAETTSADKLLIPALSTSI